MALGIEKADVFVGDFDDHAMVRIYGTENASQRGNGSTAVAGTVAGAIRYLARAITLGNFSQGSKHAPKPDSGELGWKIILDQLKDIPRVNEGTVRQQLENLKASGDYARIIAEVEVEVNEEVERELFENQPRCTDADAFYIWRVDGHWFKGLPVYKFGLTSSRIGTRRIHGCARNNDIRATEIQLFKSDTAKYWERIFHDAFTVVPDLGFTDGKTEFRACKESDVRAFVDFIRADVMPMAA